MRAVYKYPSFSWAAPILAIKPSMQPSSCGPDAHSKCTKRLQSLVCVGVVERIAGWLAERLSGTVKVSYAAGSLISIRGAQNVSLRWTALNGTGLNG